MGAGDRRHLGRGSRRAAGGQGLGRARDRHFGLAEDKLDRLKASGTGRGHFAPAPADFHDAVMKATDGKGREPRRQHRRGLGIRRMRALDGVRGAARHRGLRRRRAQERDRPPGAARQAPHALRRLQQAAHASSSAAEQVTAFQVADWLPLFAAAAFRPLIDRVVPVRRSSARPRRRDGGGRARRQDRAGRQRRRLIATRTHEHQETTTCMLDRSACGVRSLSAC